MRLETVGAPTMVWLPPPMLPRCEGRGRRALDRPTGLGAKGPIDPRGP